MIKLTDIHTHILPGIDDGAKNKTEMQDMLKMAYADGIRNIIFTPHYHIGRMKTTPEQIEKAFITAKEAADELYPDLKLYCGQEIYYHQDVLEKLEKDEILTLAKTDYVLLEYSVTTQYEIIRDSISEIYNAGFLPVIAHAERYGALFGNIKRIEDLVRTGAYIQINADSFKMPLLSPMRKFLMKLLKEDMVHFIASDAHDTKNRKPGLADIYETVVKKAGKEQAERIFAENPQFLIENKEL